MFILKISQAVEFCQENVAKIVLVKNVKVNDYDGKSLSTSIKSSFDIELVKYDSIMENTIKNIKSWFYKHQ